MVVCQTPLFSTITLDVFSFQSTMMFCLVATLFEDGNIIGMLTKPIDESRLIIPRCFQKQPMICCGSAMSVSFTNQTP